jgi:hypothetical protein
MKKLLVVLAIVPLISCSTLQTYFSGANETYLKQAFGDAIRSLEGTAISNIPAAIQAARQKWLPQGQIWSDFAAAQITAYIAAHPQTPDQAKKVLEAIATGLNLRTT